MSDKEDVKLSFELAQQICRLLEGTSGVVSGAALGHAFHTWLTNYPAAARAEIAEGFKTYALSLFELYEAEGAYDKRN